VHDGNLQELTAAVSEGSPNAHPNCCPQQADAKERYAMSCVCMLLSGLRLDEEEMKCFLVKYLFKFMQL
jgi:hypothetical protein